MGALYARHLVRGQVDAIDGRGLGADLRVVALLCVAGERPVIVAWRLLTGSASEQGQEAAVPRALVEQALALGGAGCIRLLLADALDADGPLLAWLKCVHGSDALVRLPADRLLYADVQGLARTPEVPWAAHQYVRTVQGHKQVRRVALASAGDLTSWDSFVAAARGYGAPEAALWACLIRALAPTSQPVAEASALVSTRPWADGRAALHASRPRWHSEHDGYRALKEGWSLEERHWGRDAAALRGRLTLNCLACNTAQVYRSRAGERLATTAIRRLRQQRRADLGAAPAVVYLDGCYAVLALEELLAALGTPVRESLLPATAKGSAPRPP